MAKAKYTYNEKRKEWVTLAWDGTYNADGSKHRKMISSKKSSKDLEEKIRLLKTAVESNGATLAGNVSFYDYAMQWVETSKGSKSAQTKEMYSGCIRRHFDSFRPILLQDIKHRHLQQLINANSDKPRTCQIIQLTFKQVVKSAVRDHYLPKSALEDVLEDISLPEYVKKEKRPLTEIERQAVKNVQLDQRKNAFLKILFYTGVRRGEALALTKDDFDFDRKVVSIKKDIQFLPSGSSVKYSPKSSNGFREIPLSDALIREIRPYVNSCQDYLFKTRDGGIMTQQAYKRMWESIITSLNITLGYNPNAKKDKTEKQITDLTAHIFRHNFCTELCYQIPAISTKKIAKILGDSEKMVLEVYSHIKEEKENAAEAISNALKL